VTNRILPALTDIQLHYRCNMMPFPAFISDLRQCQLIWSLPVHEQAVDPICPSVGPHPGALLHGRITKLTVWKWQSPTRRSPRRKSTEV
jgi:hypothetical protein